MASEDSAAKPHGYMWSWPLPEGHSDVVVCGNSGSTPCRALFMMIKHLNLPVDLVGIDYTKHLYSPDCLKVNPIHSIPFMLVFDGDDDKPTSINGSEAIACFLADRYSDLVGDFLPKDPLQRAKVMEKLHFISGTAYRATQYQYVYPLFGSGLMTECQYDICKRDFSLNIIEDWAKDETSGAFFEGAQVTFADFFFYSLWMGNNWVQGEQFKELPWRHCDVIDKFPSSKALIDAVADLEAVKTVVSTAIGEGDAPIELVNATGFFGMIATSMPGNARKFNNTDGGEMHPNMAMYSEDKAKYDQPKTIGDSVDI